MNQADRMKLARLLARAGASEHDGEALVYFRGAQKLVDATGSRWSDVLTDFRLAPFDAPIRDQTVSTSPTTAILPPIGHSWWQTVRRLIVASPSSITPQDAKWLIDILRRLRGDRLPSAVDAQRIIRIYGAWAVQEPER